MKKKTGSLMEGGMKRLHFDGLQDEGIFHLMR